MFYQMKTLLLLIIIRYTLNIANSRSVKTDNFFLVTITNKSLVTQLVGTRSQHEKIFKGRNIGKALCYDPRAERRHWSMRCPPRPDNPEEGCCQVPDPACQMSFPKSRLIDLVTDFLSSQPPILLYLWKFNNNRNKINVRNIYNTLRLHSNS